MEVDSLPFEPGQSLEIEPTPWHGFGFLSKVIALALPILAVGVLVLPFLNLSILRRLAGVPGLGGIVDWLLNGNGSWIAGSALIVIWLAFLAFKRWRIVSDEHQWVDAGCPQCQEHELVRVSRERGDRWYGLLGIPAYRYACRNCTWRGLRIAHRHRDRVIAHEELITASSLTLDASGFENRYETNSFELFQPVEDAQIVDEQFESVDTGSVDVPVVETAVDSTALATSETLEIVPNSLQELAPVNNHDQTEVSSDDDLEWLWRRLSDED